MRLHPLGRVEQQAGSWRGPRAHVGIVGVEHRNLVRGLMTQNRLFGATVVFDRAVPIEVVRREVRDDGDFGSGANFIEIFQLKTTQFEHGPVGRSNVVDLVEQTVSDVPAQSRHETGLPQDGVNHRGGGRFAVAARNADHPAPMMFPEQANFAGNFGSMLPGEFDERVISRDGGADDDDVGFSEVGVVMPAEPKPFDR